MRYAHTRSVIRIVGGAVGNIVSSLVRDVVMRPIGLLLGRVDLASPFVNLAATHFGTLAEAQKAGLFRELLRR